MKYYKLFGLVASILLIISCLLPWAFYPDLQKSFNGFFSEQNVYGKPGIAFTFFAVISAALLFINKIWAKRTLIFFAALNAGYLLKTYVIYTSCYKGYCPEKQYGIYFLIISSLVLLLNSFFPDIRVPDNEKTETQSSSIEK